MERNEYNRRPWATRGEASSSDSDNLQTEAVITLNSVVEILKLHDVNASRVSKKEILKRLIYLHRHGSNSDQSSCSWQQIPSSSQAGDETHSPQCNTDNNATAAVTEASSSGKRPVMTSSGNPSSRHFKYVQMQMKYGLDYCSAPVAIQCIAITWMSPQRLLQLKDFYEGALDVALGRSSSLEFAGPRQVIGTAPNILAKPRNVGLLNRVPRVAQGSRVLQIQECVGRADHHNDQMEDEERDDLDDSGDETDETEKSADVVQEKSVKKWLKKFVCRK